MTSKFKIYWLVDGVKIMNYQTMKKMVEGGKTGIEISAVKQEVEDQNRRAQAKANAILDEQIRRAAAEREHDCSITGQREAAIRFAQKNPGGVVSGGANIFEELDQYGPAKTSLLR